MCTFETHTLKFEFKLQESKCETCRHFGTLCSKNDMFSIIQSEYEWEVLLYLPIRWVRQIVRPKMSYQQESNAMFQVKGIVIQVKITQRGVAICVHG